MPLDELNDKLHGRDVHLDRARNPDIFNPKESEVAPEALLPFRQTEKWGSDSLPKKLEVSIPEPVQKILSSDAPAKQRRKRIALLFGGIACVLLIGGILIKIRAGLFSEDNIVVSMIGPAEAASAEKVVFDFEYANNNWMAIDRATIVFEYPESFRPDAAPKLDIKKSRAEYALGEVASQTHSRVTLSGKFYGSKGDQARIHATLRYSPSALSASYEKSAERNINIISSSLFFEIDAPFELVSDQEVRYDIRYSSKGDTAFSNLKVQLVYPEGFVFTESTPRPTEGDALWHVGTLEPRQEGTIVVRGRLTGGRDEQKLVQGGIGIMQGDGTFLSYGDNSRKTKMVASPFSIHQTVNNESSLSVNPGESLTYVIEYRNEGNVGIRDAIISMNLDSPYVDFSTLSFSGGTRGAYNQSSKTIFWKASDFPALSRVEPGQSGRVTFSLKLFPDVDKRFPGVRNPVIQSVAKIDSPDIPALVGLTKVVASTTLSIKLNTLMLESFLGRYQDEVIPNSGPIPPVVGQETTYTFHITLASTLNDIQDARANISLPSGIRYTGKRVPDTEKTVYNERSNELVWDIGTIVPGTRRELWFQVGVTPDASSISKTVPLVSQVIITGKDTFTDKDIRVEKAGKTSSLPEDPSVGDAGSPVQAAQE